MSEKYRVLVDMDGVLANFDKRLVEKWKEKWKKRIKKENKPKKEMCKLMEKSNPCVIPRNHLVEKVLGEAENENYRPMEEFLEVLSDPYNYRKKLSGKYTEPEITKIPYQTYCGT